MIPNLVRDRGRGRDELTLTLTRTLTQTCNVSSRASPRISARISTGSHLGLRSPEMCFERQISTWGDVGEM